MLGLAPMDETASGKSEEQHREWIEQLICSSHWYGTRLLLGTARSNTERQSRSIPKWGADQLFSPFSVLLIAVPRGSLVPYKSEDQISCAVHSICSSFLSQIQSCPLQKQGASLLRGSPYRKKCACRMTSSTKKIQTTPRIFQCLSDFGIPIQAKAALSLCFFLSIGWWWKRNLM